MKTLKLIAVVAVSATLLLQAGCSGFNDPHDIITNGASNFALGKDEDNYSLLSSQRILDDLIRNFSDSYHKPSGNQLPDDDSEDLKNDISKAEQEDEESDDGSGKTVATSTDISSDDDLIRLFRTAYSDTSEYVEFTISPSYSIGNFSEKLEYIYRELQREDPIAIACVEKWDWTYDSHSSYLLQIGYSMDIDEVKRIKRETPPLVNSVASKIKTSVNSDYEAIRAVNSYLCDNVYYPPNEPYAPVTHSPYGALKDGCAVCEGYACAAKLILNKLNIECDIELGNVIGGGGHAWNLVRLEGNWYQLDVTWNDCGSTDDFFLVTDDFMSQSRTWDRSNYPSTPTERYTP